MAERMREQARERVLAGRVDEGVRLLRVVIARTKDGPPAQHAQCLEELGHALVSARKLDEALETFETMLRVARTAAAADGSAQGDEPVVDTGLEEDALANMAFVYRTLGLSADEAAKARFYELSSAWHTRRIACATRRRIAANRNDGNEPPQRVTARTRRGSKGAVVRQFVRGSPRRGAVDAAGFWALREGGVDMFIAHGDVYRLWASSTTRRMQRILRRAALVQYTRARFLLAEAIAAAKVREDPAERLALLRQANSKLKSRMHAVQQQLAKEDTVADKLSVLMQHCVGEPTGRGRQSSFFTYDHGTPLQGPKGRSRRFDSIGMKTTASNVDAEKSPFITSPLDFSSPMIDDFRAGMRTPGELDGLGLTPERHTERMWSPVTGPSRLATFSPASVPQPQRRPDEGVSPCVSSVQVPVGQVRAATPQTDTEEDAAALPPDVDDFVVQFMRGIKAGSPQVAVAVATFESIDRSVDGNAAASEVDIASPKSMGPALETILSPMSMRMSTRRTVLAACAVAALCTAVATQTLRVAKWLRRMMRSIRGGRVMSVGRPLVALGKHATPIVDRPGVFDPSVVTQAVSLVYQIHLPEVVNPDGLAVAIENSVRWPKEDMSDASSTISFPTSQGQWTRPNSASSSRRPLSAASTRAGGRPGSAGMGTRPPSASSSRRPRPTSGGSSRTKTSAATMSFTTGLQLWQGIPEVQPVRPREQTHGAHAQPPKMTVTYFDVTVASTPLHGIAPSMLAFTLATYCPVRRELTLRLPSPLELVVQDALTPPEAAVPRAADEECVVDTVFVPSVGGLDDIVVDVDYHRAKVYTHTRNFPPVVVVRYADRGDAVDPATMRGVYSVADGTLTLVARRLPRGDARWGYFGRVGGDALEQSPPASPSRRRTTPAGPRDGTAPRFYYHNGWEEELESAVAVFGEHQPAAGVVDLLGLPFTAPRMVIYSAVRRKAAHAATAAVLAAACGAWEDVVAAAQWSSRLAHLAPAIVGGALAATAAGMRAHVLRVDHHLPAAVAAALAVATATVGHRRLAEGVLTCALRGTLDRRRVQLLARLRAAGATLAADACEAAIRGAVAPTAFHAAATLTRVAHAHGARVRLAARRGASAVVVPVAWAAAVACVHAAAGFVDHAISRVVAVARGYAARRGLCEQRSQRRACTRAAACAAAAIALCANTRRIIDALDVVQRVLRGYVTRRRLAGEKAEADVLGYIRAEAEFQARSILTSDRRMWALTTPCADDTERAAQGALITKLAMGTDEAHTAVSDARTRVPAAVLDRLGADAGTSPYQELEREHEEWLNVQQELAQPFLQHIGRAFLARRGLAPAYHARMAVLHAVYAAAVGVAGAAGWWVASTFRLQRVGRALIARHPVGVRHAQRRLKEVRRARYQEYAVRGRGEGHRHSPQRARPAVVRRGHAYAGSPEAAAAAVTIQRYWRGSRARGGVRVDWDELAATATGDTQRTFGYAGVRTGKKLRLIQACARGRLSAVLVREKREAVRAAYLKEKAERQRRRDAQRLRTQICDAHLLAFAAIHRASAKVLDLRRDELDAWRRHCRAKRIDEIEEARRERAHAVRVNAAALTLQRMERGRQARHCADIMLGREPKIVKYRKARAALSAATAIQRWYRFVQVRRARREQDIAEREERARRRRQRFGKTKLIQRLGRGAKGRRGARQALFAQLTRVLVGIQAAGRGLASRQALVTTEEYRVRRAAVDRIQAVGRSMKERLRFKRLYDIAHRAAKIIQGIVRCGNAKFKANVRRRILELRKPGMLKLALYQDAPKKNVLPMLEQREIEQLVEDEEFERPYVEHEPFIIFEEYMLPSFYDERNLLLWFRDTYNRYVRDEAVAWDQLLRTFAHGVVTRSEREGRRAVASSEDTLYRNIAMYGVQQAAMSEVVYTRRCEAAAVAVIAAAEKEAVRDVFAEDEVAGREFIAEAEANAYAVLFSQTVVDAGAAVARDACTRRLLKEKILLQREETRARTAVERFVNAEWCAWTDAVTTLHEEAAQDSAVHTFLERDEPAARHAVETAERTARTLLRQTLAVSSERPYRDTRQRYVLWETSRRDRLLTREADAFQAMREAERGARGVAMAAVTEMGIAILVNRQKVVHLRLCREESVAWEYIAGVVDHFVSVSNRTTFLKECLQELEATARADVVIAERMARATIDRTKDAEDARSRGRQAFFIAQDRLVDDIHTGRRDIAGEEHVQRAELRTAFTTGGDGLRGAAAERKAEADAHGRKIIGEQEASYRLYFEKLERTNRRRVFCTGEEVFRAGIEWEEAHWGESLCEAHTIMRSVLRRHVVRKEVEALDAGQRERVLLAEGAARRKIVVAEFAERVDVFHEIEALAAEANGDDVDGEITPPRPPANEPHDDVALSVSDSSGDEGKGKHGPENTEGGDDADTARYERTPRGSPIGASLDLSPPPAYVAGDTTPPDPAAYRTSIHVVEATSRRRIERGQQAKFASLRGKWDKAFPALERMGLRHRLNPHLARAAEGGAGSSLRSLTVDLAAVENTELGLNEVHERAKMRLYKADVGVELRVEEKFAREAIEREEAVRWRGLGLPEKAVDEVYKYPRHAAQHEEIMRRRMEAYALDRGYLMILQYFEVATRCRYRDMKAAEATVRAGVDADEAEAFERTTLTFKAGWAMIRSWETSRAALEGEEERHRQVVVFEEDAMVQQLEEVVGRLRICLRATIRTQRRAVINKQLENEGLAVDAAQTAPNNAKLKRFSMGSLLDENRSERVPYIDKHPKLAPAVEHHFASSQLSHPPFCQAHRRPESLVPGGLLEPLPPPQGADGGTPAKPRRRDTREVEGAGGTATPTRTDRPEISLAFASPEPRGVLHLTATGLAPQALVGSQVGSVARWWAATVLDGLAHPSQDGLSLSVKYDRRHFRLQLFVKHVLLPYIAPPPPAPAEINHIDIPHLVALYKESCIAIGEDDNLPGYDIALAKNRHKKILTCNEAGAVLIDRVQECTTKTFLLYVARFRVVAAAFQQLTRGPSAPLRAVWNLVGALDCASGYLPLATLFTTAHKFNSFPNRTPTFSSQSSWGAKVQYGEDPTDRLEGLRSYPWTPLGPLDANVIPSRPAPQQLTLVGVGDFITGLFMPQIQEEYTRYVVDAQPTPATHSPGVLFGTSMTAQSEPFYATLSGLLRAFILVSDTEYAKQLRTTAGCGTVMDSRKVQLAAQEGRHALDGLTPADVVGAKALLAGYAATLVKRGYPPNVQQGWCASPRRAIKVGADEDADAPREFPLLCDVVANVVCTLAGVARATPETPYCGVLADILSEDFLGELRRLSPWSVTFAQALAAVGLLRELASPYRVFAHSTFMAALHGWAVCTIRAADTQHKWDWPPSLADDALLAGR